MRFDDDGKFDAYVSAAGEAYTTKTAVLRALAPADVDAGPSAAQVWGASRPGAEDQAIAALVDGLVADVEDRLGLYDLPPTLRGDETAVRRLLEAASKRSEPLRSITSTQLARVLLDLAAPGYGAGVLSRLARSKALGKIVVCGGAAATADALAAAEAAEHAFAAGVEPDPRAAACFDPVDLALAANAHAHAFATCTRTKLEPGAPPTVVARFADLIIARCCRLELEARRAAGTLLVALRAAAAREAAAAPPVALPAAAAAVAPLTELPEAYHLLRALADVFAETDAYAYEGAEQAFGPLDAAVEARSLGRLRMAALHLFSKLDAAVFDRKWRALPSAQLNAEATAELATLKGKLAQAAGADGALASQYDAAREGIALLRLSDAELRALLPAGGDVASLPCTQDVRHLLESLQTCARARDALVADARALAARDDVTSALVYRGAGAGGDNEDVFSEALSKYEPAQAELDSMLTQQSELMGALRQANDAFTLARTEDAATAEQHTFLRKLHSALKTYGELDGQAQQGAQFYAAMAEQLEALHRRVGQHAVSGESPVPPCPGGV